MANMPLIELVGGTFNDRLLSLSAGYATLDYQPVPIEDSPPVDLAKVVIRLNGDAIDLLSSVQPVVRADHVGRTLIEQLVKLLPRQQFAVAIQATIGSRVIARETLSALRKDVTAKCVWLNSVLSGLLCLMFFSMEAIKPVK
jgi:GTP-binding protein LepA